MDYDSLAAKFGATDSAGTVDYDALASKFGAADNAPASTPPPSNSFNDALKQELANADWGTRNVAAFGSAASNLYERGKQLFGKEDRSRIDANKIISESAPVGDFAGEMLSPQSLTTMKLMPVLRGAQTLMGKAAQYAGNVGLGGGTGIALASLKPDATLETAREGATGGMIGAGVVAPLVSAAAKGSAWAYDALRGKLGDLKAAQIYRDVVGRDFQAVQAANAAAPTGVTSAQAIYNAKIQNDPLQALGEMAKRNDKETYFRPLLDAQDAAARAKISGLAGGDTQAQAMASRIGDKKALNEIFVPRMNTELNAANEGQKLAQYQNQADRLGNAASSKVEDVRRFSAAADRAENMATGFAKRNPAYGQELATRAENEASKAAADSLILGEGQRFSQGIASSLDRYGIKPLDANPIIEGLQRRLANPESAGNKKYEAVLSRVASDIQEWAAQNGGVINSRALYAIRKNSVNDAVDALSAGLDPKASAKFAASVLAETRPMIDQAITDAGGTAWGSTLKIFEKGMIPIERKEMGAKLLKMSKDKFTSAVEGNDLKAVKDVFGPGAYDISQEMGGKMRTLNPIAEQYRGEKEMLRQASAGQGGLGNILKRETIDFRLPSLVNAKFSAINKALDTMEGKINQQSLDRLITAQKSGKDANQLLLMLPTKDRENFLNAIIKAGGYSPAIVAGSSAAQ